MTTQLLTGVEDCKWLADTALKIDNRPAGDTLPRFASYILQGNEDCPIRLSLYADADPTIDDRPVAVYVLQSDLTYSREEL